MEFVIPPVFAVPERCRVNLALGICTCVTTAYIALSRMVVLKAIGSGSIYREFNLPSSDLPRVVVNCLYSAFSKTKVGT